MASFEEHPLRETLNDEVLSRPPIPLHSPEIISYLAFLHHEGSAAREAQHLRQLAEQLEMPEPDTESGQVLFDLGEFRLRWARHNEFSSYTFIRKASAETLHEEHALHAVPTVWREQIPGRLIVATHVIVRPASEHSPEALVDSLNSDGPPVVVSQISQGAGWIATDFHIRDGFSRFELINESLTPRQTGRAVQRLLEIETYRVIALLAFPVAKRVARLLARAEDELADLVKRMGKSRTSTDERDMLARLTQLAADVEESVATTTYRFGAAAAYYSLVRLRIDELRELRVKGFPTVREFMERRLTPALDTCATIAKRQEDLSERIARNSQLLRTRVDVALQEQNQTLLEQMNQRAKLQLRLQETVEGLSIVAITYYGSQLVHYLVKGVQPHLGPLTPEVITAAAIPIIAGTMFLGLRRMRKAVAAEHARIEH